MNERITKDGVCRVSDLIGELASAKDVTECVALLTAAYGKDYAHEMQERVQLLFTIVREDNWTRERFVSTAKWIILNRPYRDWTIYDWVNAPLAKLYPYSKYLSEIHEKGTSLNGEIVWYDIGGTQLWAYKKDGELPFPKWQYKTPQKVSSASNAEPMPDDVRQTFEQLQAAPVRENKLRSLDELIPQEAQ